LMRTILLLVLLTAPVAGDLDTLKAKFDAEKEKPAARAEIVAAVSALKSDESGAFLLEIFDKDKDSTVRAAALKGLGDWASPAALKKLAAVASDPQQQFTFR